ACTQYAGARLLGRPGSEWLQDFCAAFGEVQDLAQSTTWRGSSRSDAHPLHGQRGGVKIKSKTKWLTVLLAEEPSEFVVTTFSDCTVLRSGPRDREQANDLGVHECRLAILGRPKVDDESEMPAARVARSDPPIPALLFALAPPALAVALLPLP